MESLLPSEIARLVYGYLIDEKCDAAAQLFLETSEFLKECNIAQKKGRKFNTRVMGLCLVDILNLYTDAVCMLKNYKDKNDITNAESNNVIQELQNVLFVDELSDKNASKTVFLRISIPPKRKSSGSPEKSGKKENEEKVVESKGQEKKKEETNIEPSVTGNQGKLATPNLDDFDLNMLQTLLDNTALHERLAENINKAIDSSGEINNPKTDEKKIIETVLHSTEADPIFDELLHMLVAPRAEDTNTPEDTDKENGDPTEDRMELGLSSTKEEETIKRLEAESNLAIEGILAGNKKLQQETSTSLPSPSNLIPIDKSQIPPHLLGAIKEVSSIPASPATSNAMVIPLNSSTPLQPIDASNIPMISFLSPGQPVRVLQKVASVGTRGGLQPRRRRIIPKPDPATLPSVIHVQVQNQDFNQEAVQSVPEVLKKPVARTRGGRSRGRGSRGVRSITPQISKLNDDKINVVFVESKASGIKTRSVYKRQQKCTIPQTKKQIDSEQIEVPLSDTTDQQNKLSGVLEGSNETSNVDVSPQKSSEDHQEPLSTQLFEENELPTTSSQENLERSAEDDQNTPLNQVQSLEKLSLPAVESGIDEYPEPPEESPGNAEDSTSTTDLAPSTSTNTEPLTSSNIASQSSSSIVSQTTNIVPLTNIAPSTSVDIEPSTSDKQPSTSGECSMLASEKKEMCDDGTPEQQAVISKLKTRVSLSTPRRGSHIRVLDFKTPDKNNLEVRKSLTSPKVYAKSKQLDKLDNVKRGIFKSPEQNKELEKKRSWDADLRKYFSPDAMDIPTSVGLKRKNGSKKDIKSKKKGGKSGKPSDLEETDNGSPSKPLCSSNEDLVKQIEKEVRDVIGDEELSLNTSGNSETLNICDKKLQCVGSISPGFNSSGSDMEIEEIDNEKLAADISATDPKNIDKEGPVDKPPNESPPQTCPEIDKDLPAPVMTSSPVKENSSEIEGNMPPPIRFSQEKIEIEHSSPTLENSENTKVCHLEKQASETENSHSFSTLEQQLYSATPLKLSMSPSTDNSVGEITPTTKLLMSHLGTSMTSPVLSPIAHSYSNLESILITEGTRLEQEKALLVAEGITKLSDNIDEQKSAPENSLNDLQPTGSNEVVNSHENNEKRTSSENNDERIVSIFQTPAKPSDYVPPGIPVEMTPLTKVLHSETKIFSTALVTPTLPATPKPPHHQEKSPNRTDTLHELAEESPCKETFVEKEAREGNIKGDSMPFIKHKGNNQKKQLKQSILNTTKENPAQSKIIDSGKQEGTPLPLKSQVKKSGNLPSPRCRSVKKQTLKVCKTPRIQLLPKMPSDYFTPKPKLERKKSKSNEFMSVSLTSAKGVLNEEMKLGNRNSNEHDKVMDIENGSSTEGFGLSKKTRELNASTSKMRKVKTSPTVELNSTRKRRALQKSPPGKKSSKFQLDLMKEEEQVLRECLQNAKAKLFGIGSSDSDSSDECVSKEANNSGASNKSKRNSSTSSVKEKESVKPHLFTARDRLKKLESVSMLDSSDSSDDSLIVPPSSRSCPIKAGEKKTVEAISRQTSVNNLQALQLQTSNERSKSRADNSTNSEIRKVGSPKKSEKIQPVNDNSKLPSNVREKEESCESFPTLYLSEESNMSMVSESHTTKSMKFRKSPSAGNDLLSKKPPHFLPPNSTLVKTNSEKPYFKPLNDNSYTSSSNVVPQNHPAVPGDHIGTADSQAKKTVKGLDAYETVSHQTPSKPTLLSNQECQVFTEFLNNYTYSFTLDADGREDLLCKTLRTSPFYTIFELNSKDSSRSEHKKKIPERSVRVDKGKSPPSHERPRKRHRSESSEDEHRKFRRFHRNPRRDYWNTRPRPLPHRRRDFSSEKSRSFSSPRYQNSPHYRTHSYSFDRKRSRRDSMETNESGKREEKRPHKKTSSEKFDTSPHSSKSSHFSHYSIKDKGFNESFRSSKSSESDRLLVDHSFRSSASPCDLSGQINTSVNDRTHPNLVKNKQEILQFARTEEKEDGELSDSSSLQPMKSSAQLAAAAAEAKRKELIALVTDKSRASLLKKIDLDHFLTLLHGEEK